MVCFIYIMIYFVAIKVIKELTVQRAHNELFSMALEIEQHSRRRVQKILTAVSILLQQITTYLDERMVSDHGIVWVRALTVPVMLLPPIFSRHCQNMQLAHQMPLPRPLKILVHTLVNRWHLSIWFIVRLADMPTCKVNSPKMKSYHQQQ